MTHRGRRESPYQTTKFNLRRRFFSLPTLASFVIAFVLIGFLWAQFDLDISATWKQIKASSPGFLVVAVLLHYSSFPVRGLRWRLLLDNCEAFREKESSRPSLLRVSAIILISWLANSILWFRLGDAYRAYLISRPEEVSFSRTIGTVAAERLIDVIMVFGLLLVAGLGLIATGDNTPELRAVELAATSLATLGVVGLIGLRIFGPRLGNRLPKQVQPIYIRFLEGTFGSFRHLPTLIVLTGAVWLLESARLYFVVQALGFEVGLALVLLAALAHSMLTTIPLTPGGLGFVELGLAGLLAITLSPGDAAVVTLLERSITYFSIVVVGAAVFAAYHIVELRRGPNRTGSRGNGAAISADGP